jgi:hypothetical protein
MAAYDQRSERLPVGWQKLLVLRGGIAGSEQNLDDGKIEEWAYTAVKDEHPEWLGDFDEDVDRDMPMRWLTQTVGVNVLMARRLMAEPPPSANAAAGGGCLVAALALVVLTGAVAMLGML